MAKLTAEELLEQLQRDNPELAAQVAAYAPQQQRLLGREEVRQIAELTYPAMRRLVDRGIVTPTIPSPSKGVTDRWDVRDAGRLAVVAAATRFFQTQDPRTDQALQALWLRSAEEADAYFLTLVGDAYLVDTEPSTGAIYLVVSGVFAQLASAAAATLLEIGGVA